MLDHDLSRAVAENCFTRCDFSNISCDILAAITNLSSEACYTNEVTDHAVADMLRLSATGVTIKPPASNENDTRVNL